jgi:serine/threonine protein kinase
MNDDFATLVIPDAAPAAPKPAAPRAALARLAFGSVPSSVAAHTLGPRHLAFLPPESLELDLNDPAQRTFGDYELIDKLGQGGMGVVYRARQRSLEREVALKLLSAGPWASKDFIERFRREAQSAARMQHPNIVAIYEIGAHDELNFFSMRLVQGVSLAHQLQESGPLAPKRAAQLMRAIAEALDYAHRLGVLHLDLKPANVLIDERGEPQVADFGLARRLDETLTRDNDEGFGHAELHGARAGADQDAQAVAGD